MPREIREWSEIRVVGELWEPGVLAAHSYVVSEHAINNLLQGADKPRVEYLTRQDVEDWAWGWFRRNAGDFLAVTDYEVDFCHGGSQLVLCWTKALSRDAYNEAMGGVSK